jgi:ureidoacrylate peracid hydrolase
MATVRHGQDVPALLVIDPSYSDEQMHAALDINIPNYASSIVTAHDIVDSISSSRISGLGAR